MNELGWFTNHYFFPSMYYYCLVDGHTNFRIERNAIAFGSRHHNNVIMHISATTLMRPIVSWGEPEWMSMSVQICYHA